MKSFEGPQLSILVQGRNDSYMGNFLWRLSTCINKHADNIGRLDAWHRAEIVLTDWGSVVPLSQALALTVEGRRALRIVQVTPATAAKYNSNSPYSWVHAVNTSARRCRGTFILFCDSDGYLPLESLRLLLEGVSENRIGDRSLSESFFVGSRRHIPARFHCSSPGLPAIDEFIQKNQATFEHDKVNLNSFGGNSASYLWSKSIWEECRGFDERLIQWGWYDIDLFIRLSLKYRAADLEDFGILTYHLEHYTDRDSRTAQQGLNRACNPMTMPERYAPNGRDWGLLHEPLEVVSWPILIEIAGAADASETSEDQLYFRLHKIARFIYLTIVMIERDERGRGRDELAEALEELGRLRAAMVRIANAWATPRSDAIEAAFTEEARKLCDRGDQLLGELFKNERVQQIWRRSGQAGSVR